LENPSVDGKIILKWVLKKWNGGGGGIDWIDLAQEKDRWLAVVNTMMNLRVP
jgi:hypothetical protein